MHATDPVESKPRKLGYDSVHMDGRDKRTLAEAPGQSPSKNPDACCELAEEQWLEVSMAGTSSSAYRPIEAPRTSQFSPCLCLGFPSSAPCPGSGLAGMWGTRRQQAFLQQVLVPLLLPGQGVGPGLLSGLQYATCTSRIPAPQKMYQYAISSTCEMSPTIPGASCGVVRDRMPCLR